MSVKINIIKPIEKKKLTYKDLTAGAFFFYNNYPYKKEYLLIKTGNGGHTYIENGHYTSPNNIPSDSEVVLADVVIDVQIKE